MVVALAGRSAAQPALDPPMPFAYGCDSWSIDLKNNRSICTNIEITDGEITIAAALGTTDETSFENTQWRFEGAIRVSIGTTLLTADSASFFFESNALAVGELSGSPVEITDFIEEQQSEVRGTADAISLDNRTQTAALTGQATLAIGANEYAGCDLVYHLTEKTFNSGSSDCRVVIRLSLDNDEDDSGDDSSLPP
jgi:lipopolysaccharide transport protein LptA